MEELFKGKGRRRRGGGRRRISRGVGRGTPRRAVVTVVLEVPIAIAIVIVGVIVAVIVIVGGGLGVVVVRTVNGEDLGSLLLHLVVVVFFSSRYQCREHITQPFLIPSLSITTPGFHHQSLVLLSHQEKNDH